MSNKETLQTNNGILTANNDELDAIMATIENLPSAVTKPTTYTSGDLIAFDANGNAADSGIVATTVATKTYVDDKVDSIDTSALMDKPASGSFTTGNMAMFDAAGNAVDSGLSFSIVDGELRVTYDDGQ